MTLIVIGFSSPPTLQFDPNFQKSKRQNKKAPRSLHQRPKWNLGVRESKGRVEL
jgi:hypothetical protein